MESKIFFLFQEIGLTNLKLLNMSSNKLSQIHFQGFEGLSNLKSLDLSYNMLKYFLDHWWVSLNSLEELYLAGNMLRTINTEPRIKLQKLKVSFNKNMQLSQEEIIFP